MTGSALDRDLLGFTSVSLNPYDPETSTDMERIRGEQSSVLHGYWLEKQGAAALPAWSSFEFMDLYRIAPSMIVYDVDDPGDANTLRYRFVGTTIVKYRKHRTNPDLTGQTFADGQRAYDPTAMAAAFNACMREARPILMQGNYQTEFASGEHERLIVPWSLDGVVARLTSVLDRY